MRIGPAGPQNRRRRLNELRTRAGITEWPHSAMRHSFATYHLEQHRDPAKTAAALGHVGGLTLL